MIMRVIPFGVYIVSIGPIHSFVFASSRVQGLLRYIGDPRRSAVSCVYSVAKACFLR